MTQQPNRGGNCFFSQAESVELVKPVFLLRPENLELRDSLFPLGSSREHLDLWCTVDDEDYQLEMNIWDWAMTCLFLFWKHLAITDWIEDNHHCQVLRCWYRMTFSDINYPITMSTMQAREDRLIGRILDPTHPTHLPAPISLGSPLRGLKFVICDPCAASTLCDPL